MDGALAHPTPPGAAADAAALQGPPGAGQPRRRGRAVTGGTAAARERGGRGRSRAGGRGRGRGRKRRRSASPAAAPAAQPGASDEEHHASDSEGADSEQDDLAAAQAAEARGAAPPAPQLPLRDQALLLLLNQGAPRDKAELAVDEAAEQLAKEQGGQVFTDAVDWADAALLALTARADFEAERDDVALAMEESLEEAQARKAAEKPLKEKDAAELAQVFCTSQLLPSLGRRFAAQSLLQPPLHGPLLELLQLEKKCIKWYDCKDCARWYFHALADSLQEQLGSICGDDDAPGGGDQAAAAAAAGAPGPAGAAGQAQQLQHPQPLAIGDNERDLLAALVDSEYERIARIVLLESRGNDEVPQLFLDAVPPDVQPDEVDLCSDDEGEAQQQQQQQQQQQPAAAAAAQEEPS